ncbi:alpha/beta fold hydrolase [Maricaulaceae bacterium MS644]
MIAAASLAAILSAGLSANLAAQPQPGETQIEFTAESGDTVAAYRGSLEVFEHRANPASRMITLSYVRFPTTTQTPGDPIVYLAGGPGGSGSGTAAGRRFPLFMAMREHGDVIALDQRGTGDSTALPACRTVIYLAEDRRVASEEMTSAYRAAALECRSFWAGEGIAIEGYTTLESVADLSDLRRHLGAQKLDLWGISYGTHLALAAMKTIPDELDQIILASAEGLDQTVKLPSRTDAFFARLSEAVASQPEAAARYGDVVALMRRVQARLEAEPMMLTVQGPDGAPMEFAFTKDHLQMLSGAASDPQNALWLLPLYATLDAGEPGMAQVFAQRFFNPGEPITMRAMSTAMDIASGISPARMAQFEAQSDAGLTGPYLNFPMPQLANVWPDMDLGEAFRQEASYDGPVLVLTGTLDGRTYPEGQREATAGLSDLTAVTVINAGHNLFMTSPDVGAAMHAFMRGEPVAREITVPLPDFAGE